MYNLSYFTRVWATVFWTLHNIKVLPFNKANVIIRTNKSSRSPSEAITAINPTGSVSSKTTPRFAELTAIFPTSRLLAVISSRSKSEKKKNSKILLSILFPIFFFFSFQYLTCFRGKRFLHQQLLEKFSNKNISISLTSPGTLCRTKPVEDWIQ